jgi:hypothetical protein
MTWIFVVVGAVAVFAVAAVTVGREAFRLGHQPRPTIFDLDEAVAYVADDLSDEAQALLSYDEVRGLVFAELEHLRDQGIIALPGEESERGRMVVEPTAAGNGEADSVVVDDDDAVAVVLGQAETQGIDVTDEDVFAVVASLHRYLAAIGAVGPAAGPQSS